MEKRILIADDEPEFLAALGTFLRQRGYVVIEAMNGKEAIEKVLQHKPHLIILDILMPEIDGTDAAMILRDDPRTKRIPLFFLTAVVSPDDQKSIKSNPNTIFGKPVNFEELLKAIQRVDTLKD